MPVEIVVPLALFAAIVAVCLIVMFFRFRSRQELQLTVRAAMDSGQQLSPEVLGELTAALNPPQGDLRRGVVGLAIGLALVCFGFLLGEPDARGPLLAFSAFPFFVGVAYLLLYFLNRPK